MLFFGLNALAGDERALTAPRIWKHEKGTDKMWTDILTYGIVVLGMGGSMWLEWEKWHNRRSVFFRKKWGYKLKTVDLCGFVRQMRRPSLLRVGGNKKRAHTYVCRLLIF